MERILLILHVHMYGNLNTRELTDIPYLDMHPNFAKPAKLSYL